MNRLPIIDLFTSIQGEGKYSGVPSIFIRVSGCNLRCVFKNSICDTPYSSFNPEQSRYDTDSVLNILKANPQIHHIVVTGGEPMLYEEQLIELFKTLQDKLKETFWMYTITIETNGTLDIRDRSILDWVNLWSISPKLKSSVPVPDQKVYCQDKEYAFSAEMCNTLDERRKNIQNIANIIKHGVDVQLKFVYSGEESYEEILLWRDEILDNIGVLGDSLDLDEIIMLMPEGVTEEVLMQNRKEAVDRCTEHGWYYTDRLHIVIFGDKRGY